MTASVVLPAGAGRNEWLTARTRGLGGSDVAAAVGVNPYKTPYQVWLEKAHGLVEEPDERAAERMRWGQRLEPLLLREFGEQHPELVLAGAEGTYADTDEQWRLFNPDALTFDEAGCPDGVVEAKTGGHRQVAAWADGEVPTHYVCQLQWYLDGLTVPGGWMVALLDTNTYIETYLKRDHELGTMLREQARAFWHDNVLADVPPPVDATDDTARLLARRVARAGSVLHLDEQQRATVEQYHHLGRLIGELKTERDELGNRIRELLGEHEEAHLDGQKVVTFRAPSKGVRRCDLARLAERHPDAYTDCVTTPAPSRRLTVTAPKEQQ